MGKSTVYYAIGDVHGMAERLSDLHEKIDEFHGLTTPDAAKHLIHLGDYVDRGPDSKGVIDLLIARQTSQPEATTCLMGNHEEMMLDAIDGKEVNFWRRNGGEETLQSYKIDNPNNIPLQHVEWLRALPTLYSPEGTNLIFVHAGVDPTSYPDDDPQKRRWMRGNRFFDTTRWVNPALAGKRVIHGHTPTNTDQADVTADGRRVNVDTGAAYGGSLTAVVLQDGNRPIFLQA